MAGIRPDFRSTQQLQIPGGAAQMSGGGGSTIRGPAPQGPSAGERIGGALAGAGQALRQGALDADNMKTSEARRQLMAKQQELVGAQTGLTNAQIPGAEAMSSQQQIKLQQMERQQKIQQQLDQAALQGPKSYLKTLQSLDPERAQVYVKGQQQLQMGVQAIVSAQTKNKSDQIELQKQVMTQLGSIGQAIRSFGPPNLQAEAYRLMLPQIRTLFPQAPKTYDPLHVQLWVANGVAVNKKQVPAGQTELGKLEADRQKGLVDFESYKLKKSEILNKSKNEELAKLKEQKFGNSQSLRKEFTAMTKDYVKVRDAYRRVVASAQNPSAAGDLALIFNYMKVLDPGSVVRESEFATAAASGGYGERIKAAMAKIQKGERLSDSMRQDFVDRTKKLMESQQKGFDSLKTQFTEIATRNNLDPKEVIADLDVTEKEKGMDSLQAQADAAIKAGADPEAVRARLEELRKKGNK